MSRKKRTTKAKLILELVGLHEEGLNVKFSRKFFSHIWDACQLMLWAVHDADTASYLVASLKFFRVA